MLSRHGVIQVTQHPVCCDRAIYHVSAAEHTFSLCLFTLCPRMALVAPEDVTKVLSYYTLPQRPPEAACLGAALGAAGC